MNATHRLVLRPLAALALTLSACGAPLERGESTEPLAQIAPAEEDALPGDLEDLPGLEGPRDMDKSGCTIPPDCKDVRTPGLNLNVCCTKKVACGMNLKPLLDSLLHPGNGVPTWLIRQVLREAMPKGVEMNMPCAPPASMWMPTPAIPDERFTGAPGKDILVTKGCPSRALMGFPLYGCCMPNNKCGYSTHYLLSDLRNFESNMGAVEHAQCGTAEEMDAIIKTSQISQFAGVPAQTGTCNHKALDAQLPPAAVWE